MIEEDYARYPFSAEARAFIIGGGYTLDRLLGDDTFAGVRALALRRIRCALSNMDMERLPGESALTELLSYPIARAVVASLRDGRLSSRLVVWESKRLAYSLAGEAPETVFRLGGELDVPAAFRHTPSGAPVAALHFSDYVRYSSRLKDDAWKMSARTMVRGTVFLPAGDYARLLEEAFKMKELEKMSALELVEVPQAAALAAELGPALEHFRQEVQIEGEVRQWAFPPCMQALLREITQGRNLPHTARFALSAFLHNVGLESEDVLNTFAHAPDFDIEKARYQVEHICNANYTAPLCKTMKSYGNCPGGDNFCPYVEHPLAYYRKTARRMGK